MNIDASSGSILHGGNLTAALVVTLFLVWTLARQVRVVRIFLRRYRRGGAILDFVLLPAAVYAAGYLVGSTLGHFGLYEWQTFVAGLTHLGLFLAFGYGASRIIAARIEERSEGGQGHMSRLARTTLVVVCMFVGFLLFLVTNNYSPAKLYVSTGALAAILAFAMQQTLGDFFSGLALSIEKPFQTGDRLRFDDGTEGVVVDINWRSTQLKSANGGLFVLPNAMLSRQRFLNLRGPGQTFAQGFDIRVSGEADPREVISLLSAAALRCQSVLRSPEPIVQLKDASVDPYTYSAWVYFADYLAMFAGREDLYLEMHAALRDAGLKVAAPIQEIRQGATDNKAMHLKKD
ncbi:Small-conductance mechanosensitive channel [Rhodovulum sp. ES.010]|uniref:mechanosensitive ion channel family protein n=1 Tax=Rhodovulum sp. ES.010 TaxID=1882821 RepID=UPI000929AA4C|nr:mechanosensitive ion channel family protein [Rhodovulum sp. ES.010]SIO44196.1 Small-conductance mechanosensitive channel [Rhodovulum sp. ES.010]